VVEPIDVDTEEADLPTLVPSAPTRVIGVVEDDGLNSKTNPSVTTARLMHVCGAREAGEHEADNGGRRHPGQHRELEPYVLLGDQPTATTSTHTTERDLCQARICQAKPVRTTTDSNMIAITIDRARRRCSNRAGTP